MQDAGPTPDRAAFRQRLHLALDSHMAEDRWSTLAHRTIVTLILVSLVAMILE